MALRCGWPRWVRGMPIDLQQVIRQARLSATFTHTHPEGIAGAVAVAVAAALAAPGAGPTEPADFVAAVLAQVPPGPVRDGLEAARRLRTADVGEAAELLGSGRRVSAQDTVPFAIWAASRHPTISSQPSGSRPLLAATSTPPARSWAGSSVPASGTPDFRVVVAGSRATPDWFTLKP